MLLKNSYLLSIFLFKKRIVNSNKGIVTALMLILGLTTLFVFSVIPFLKMSSDKAQLIQRQDESYNYIYNIKKQIAKYINTYPSKKEFIYGTKAKISSLSGVTTVDLSILAGSLDLYIDSDSFYIPITIPAYDTGSIANPLSVTLPEIVNIINLSTGTGTSSVSADGSSLTIESSMSGSGSRVELKNTSLGLLTMLADELNTGKSEHPIDSYLQLSQTGSLFIVNGIGIDSSAKDCILYSPCKSTIRVKSYDEGLNKITIEIKIEDLGKEKIKKNILLEF